MRIDEGAGGGDGCVCKITSCLYYMPRYCDALFLMFVNDKFSILSSLLFSRLSTISLSSDGVSVHAGGVTESDWDRRVSSGWPPLVSS